MPALLPGIFNHDRFRRGRTDRYQTPLPMFLVLHLLYQFNIDAAADRHNHLCPQYLTKERSALTRRWRGRIFCNPPFSNIAAFVLKAYWESLDGALVVMLLPAYVDAAWFLDLCEPFGYVKFLRGRVGFGAPGQPNAKTGPAFFPNLLVTFPKERAIVW